jgi:hypothetical protein
MLWIWFLTVLLVAGLVFFWMFRSSIRWIERYPKENEEMARFDVELDRREENQGVGAAHPRPSGETGAMSAADPAANPAAVRFSSK